MLYYVLWLIVTLILKTLYRIRVEGSEYIPKKGPLIVASNHCSYLDPLVLSVIFPRRIHWIAKKELFKLWYLRWFFVITSMSTKAGPMEKATEVLRRGGVVGIFPEGVRSYDGSLKRGKLGAAFLGFATGVSVLPVGISGTFQIYPPRAKFPNLFRCIKIRFGPIVTFNHQRPDKKSLKDATLKIMGSIDKNLSFFDVRTT